ncbi:hypothetical protein I5E68_07200 [Novosphingobium sp. YJ-S2-02]|uniref:Uncharacterized protein n=1 Tax=Novosphingobium aureum TaxID=2792964 RepID=A0A931HB36_9SPHN|nr:hypothetical protein [Novosphingobium aureum]MBH0112737.1 hypothetical protein [Novosphingobium aureum]
MTQRSNNVFPNRTPLTEEQFRSNWLVTLARLCREHGDSQVALWLGVSERHLRNLKTGLSLPSADKVWNLLAFDQSAHDEIDAAYGVKNVPVDSVCSSDPLTLDMIALAHEVAEHEAPDSHGGIAVTDHELRLKDERRLRKVHQTLGTWLARLDAMRGVVTIGGRAA